MSPGHGCLQPLPAASGQDLQQKKLRFNAGPSERQGGKHNCSSSSSATCISPPKHPSASELGVQPPMLWVSQLWVQFAGSEQSHRQHRTIPMQQLAPSFLQSQKIPSQ